MTRALTFPGRPRYIDVVAALAAMPPADLRDVHIALDAEQWHELQRELTAPPAAPRTHLCGIPLEVSYARH